MTYAELGRVIGRMTDKQKQMDITVFDETIDEFIPVDGMGWVKSSDEHSDVLEDGHPYLVTEVGN